MIPKKIHYCWFGGKPLPHLAKRCIKSWKKYLPDYEIIEWNESNFNINICPYTQEAYQAQKYAFVSDYARFWILYHYGGVYFDTDVEIIKPIDHILGKGAFMACEELNPQTPNHLYPKIAAGLGLAVEAKNSIYKNILDKYNNLHYILPNGDFNQTTVVTYITDIFIQNGLQPNHDIQEIKGITIYPPEYFCPKSYYDKKIRITSKTVSIHHFDGSWISKKQKFKDFIKRLLKLKCV